MANSRLIGIVTALLFLTASQGVRAEILLEHLIVIDRYLSNNDIQSLYSYLEKNPELLTGDDELSQELRSFYDEAAAGNLDFDYAGTPESSDTTSVETALQH